MIRIATPKSFEQIASLFPEENSKKYLYMAAFDDGDILAVAQFIYHQEIVDVLSIRFVEKEVNMAIIDGLIRTVLFQTADAGCTACRFFNMPENLKPYFYEHQFKKVEDYLWHNEYIDEFFKPCPGCAHG